MEQSAAIWHSSLTEENRTDLERVQKNALRIILKEDFQDYNTALKQLKLDSLEERREKLLFKFGKKCTQLEQTKELFPLHSSEHAMQTRQSKTYTETQCYTERLRKSTIPYLHRMLNEK